MNLKTCILSTAYWPPIHYFSKFLNHSVISIEQWENYPKQTYRNRCQIYSPNGIQPLIVPVERGSFHKTAVKDLKIAYDTNWQKNHVKSIDAAYRSSPFFEFYIDDIMPFYEKRYTYLIDLNSDILTLSLKWLKLKPVISKTLTYEAAGDFVDCRNSLHPKSNLASNNLELNPVAYMQGFEQRHGFVPNLSILDLVFNTGSEAASILKKT
jgi:hypothetical protein